MKDVLFSIGSFQVHGYGLMIAIGVLSAYFLTEYRAKKQQLQYECIFTLAIWALLGGVVGAKLLYYLTTLQQIIEDPSRLLDIGNGFVVYGGIVGGVIAGYFYCRYKKFNFLCYADLVMPAIALAQGFGRIGCLLAGCCYGIETASPIGMVFPEGSLAQPAGVPLVPTQLISSILDFLLFFFLLLYSKRKKAHGQVTAFYLILYSVGRFILEYFRGDLIRGSVGELSTSQFISIFIFIAGVLLLIFAPKLSARKERREALSDQEEDGPIEEFTTIDLINPDEAAEETKADAPENEAASDEETANSIASAAETEAKKEGDNTPPEKKDS